MSTRCETTSPKEEEVKKEEALKPDKSPAQIFKEIQDEEDNSKKLPSRKGFLKLQSLDPNPLNNTSHEVFCVLKNKCLKWYADGPRMMEIDGVIDFDILKCVILIEEKHFDSEEHSFQETPQQDT